MKLLNFLYTIGFAICALANSNASFNSKILQMKTLSFSEQLSTTMNAIYFSILENRRFVSASTVFEVWEDPSGDLILIPFVEDFDSPSISDNLGVGYKLITASGDVITQWNIFDELLNVSQIKEEDIQTKGFPHLFEHTESSTDDDLFKTWKDEEWMENDAIKFGDGGFTFVGVGEQSKDTFIEEAAVYETKYQYVTILTTTTVTETLNNHKPVETFDKSALSEADNENSKTTKTDKSATDNGYHLPHSSKSSNGYFGIIPRSTSTVIQPTSTFYYDTIITSGAAKEITETSSKTLSGGYLSFRGTEATTISAQSNDRTKSSITSLQSGILSSMRNSVKGSVASSSVTILTVSNSTLLQNNGIGDYKFELLNSTFGILCLMISMIVFT